MTRRDAEKFASRILRDARYNVRVKIGRTNGAFVFHVVNTEAQDKRFASITLPLDAGEWLAHPWNKINREIKRPEPVDYGEFTEGLKRATEGLRRFSAKAREATVAMEKFKSHNESEASPT